MEYRHYIVIGNRRFEYVIKPSRKMTVFVCQDANIQQTVPNEKLPELLANLPRLIVQAISSSSKQSEVLRFRVTQEEKTKIIQDAIEHGFDNVSAYIRYKLLGE